MDSIGRIRKLDCLGRVALPAKLRRQLDINNASVEFFVKNDRIILKKYEPICMFCGTTKHIVKFKGKNVCQRCLEESAIIK